MSGISTARSLLNAQPTLKVLLVEARDRVGGRMDSQPTNWTDAKNERWRAALAIAAGAQAAAG